MQGGSWCAAEVEVSGPPGMEAVSSEMLPFLLVLSVSVPETCGFGGLRRLSARRGFASEAGRTLSEGTDHSQSEILIS